MRKMKKIVLDMQSGIHAHNMERMLLQKLEDYQVVISESPDSTADWCRSHRPDVLLMEVKAYSPWMFLERMQSATRSNGARKTAGLFCLWMTTADDESNGKGAAGKAGGADRRVPVWLRLRNLFCLGHRRCVTTPIPFLKEE